MPGSEEIPLPGEIHMTDFIPITRQECVEAHSTGTNGTGAKGYAEEANRTHCTTRRVKFQDDQEWSLVPYRTRNGPPEWPRKDIRPLKRPIRRK